MATLNTLKAAVKANDYKLIAENVRGFRKAGLSDREIYRMALAADPNLDFDTWTDTVTTALEKNPETPNAR